jgi:hypothetical protein
MIRDQQIHRIKHTMLDRLAQTLAAAMRRYSPPAYHRHCPKMACRRSRSCRHAGTGARTDACVGRLHAQTEKQMP